MVTAHHVIDIADCLALRDVTEPRLAPDGRTIGFVEVVGSDARVMICAFDDPTSPGAPRALTGGPAVRSGRGFGGGAWCWASEGAAIVHAAVDGDLWWQPVDGGAAVRITEHGPDRVAQAPSLSPDGRSVAYVVDQCEVWVTELASRRQRAGRVDDGSADFCFDPVFDPASTMVAWHAWDVPNMPWDRSRLEMVSVDGARVIGRRSIQGRGAVQQPRFAADGTLVSVRDDTGWANLWWGDEVLVDESAEHAGPAWGLGQRSFAVDPTGARVAFTRNEHGFGRLCVVDVRSGRVDEIGRGVHGQLSWVAVEGGTRLSALRSGARTPSEVVVVDIDDEAAAGTGVRHRVMTTADTAWNRDALVEPELTAVHSVGGVVHSRLYRADPSSGPDRLICWLHGGPTDQWQVTFLPRLAYWRSRGWHIVVPDHRGSTGHGRQYQQALNGRWGELDVDDTAAVLRHAHSAGWADAAHTVLMGASAGGFTVLGVLARHPSLAAAAVVSSPVADLADLAERSHRFERHSTWSLVGPPGSTAEIDRRYRDRSPVSFAPSIRTPLLVFHGDADPVVPVQQSRVLAARIRAAGGDVELCIRPGEGHGIRQRHHQMDEYVRTAAFLRRHVPESIP